MSTQDLGGRKSTLLQRYQPTTSSQDPINHPMDSTGPITKSTSQRSLQNSSLLQKYYTKTNSQDIRTDPTKPSDANFQMSKKTSSQRSLDQSKLLQRYQKQHSQDSQDIPKPEPARYSSQKNLESSKLLQRYNPVNNSQEFTGLAARESTPVARFQRSGSLDQDRMVRPSLLSRYTPRFGQSLDRNKAVGVGGYSNYSSQQSLDQTETKPSGDYSSDHFDQYDARNLRSRSSSLARGVQSKSAQREMESLARRFEAEKENVPLDPVTQETLPVVLTPEPVTGNIASALPLPMLGLIPPTPAIEVPPTVPEPTHNTIPTLTLTPTEPATVAPEQEKPKRKEPVKPPRKDLASSATHLFRSDVPLAQEESFTTPLPTPRRSRSRSQISKAFDDDRTSRGAESYIFGADDNAMIKHSIDMSDSNGYAIVRKDPPPRPPAPIRRRKSTRSLDVDQRQFSTLPNYHSVSPVRPIRNYSTISPNRPPRRKSITSLTDNQPKSASVSKDDITQYEDIEDVDSHIKTHHTLQSGAVLSKMKDRPLPPPPRPPRDGKKSRKPDFDDKHDFDGGAERITMLEQIHPRIVQEVEIAIQTDPLPDDFELDIEVSETIDAAEGPLKTVQEILMEQEQAEIDVARQLTEASNLMRDIQKFRDSTSSLSLHGSRPETPAGILLERRVSTPADIRSDRRTPISLNGRPLSIESLTEQDLAHVDDDKYIAELVNKYVSEEKVAEPSVKPRRLSDNEFPKQRPVEATVVRETMTREETRPVQSEPAAPPRRRSLVGSNQDLPRSVEIPSNVIEEIVERLRTNEQQHIAELQQLHLQQLEDLKKQQEEQKRLQEQKLDEQQKHLLEQQNQQLHETQQLKEQIIQQQEQQKALLHQQQQQQEQLLLAQQQQQLLLQQQEKERELQRERERELLREREIELEKARERERELHHARELELQRVRELEQQRSKEMEQQRLREMELQRAMEAEHQRLRELEIQRAHEVEQQRAREAELHRARELELQRAAEAEIQRLREVEHQRAIELELQRVRQAEKKAKDSEAVASSESVVTSAEVAAEGEAAADEPTVGEPTTAEPTPADTSKETPPVRPPPPRVTPQVPLGAQYPYQEYLPYSLPPQPFYPVRNYSEDEGALPQAPHRRRRHHRSRRESTSEEEFQREQRKQRHGTRSPEPSIPSLGGQLIRACGTSICQTGEELMVILRASSKDENKRDLHVALIILIVIVAGLMALGMSGDKSIHHHHWDYFNPPGNSGNA